MVREVLLPLLDWLIGGPTPLLPVNMMLALSRDSLLKVPRSAILGHCGDRGGRLVGAILEVRDIRVVAVGDT